MFRARVGFGRGIEVIVVLCDVHLPAEIIIERPRFNPRRIGHALHASTDRIICIARHQHRIAGRGRTAAPAGRCGIGEVGIVRAVVGGFGQSIGSIVPRVHVLRDVVIIIGSFRTLDIAIARLVYTCSERTTHATCDFFE